MACGIIVICDTAQITIMPKHMTILEFIDSSPSPAWTAETGAQLLKKGGFTEVSEVDFAQGNKIFLRPHPGMLIAAAVPGTLTAEKAAFRVIGAHTDSPHLRLKPNAASEGAGHRVLMSEIYGGALIYTWFDRELGLAGEIYHKEGNQVSQKLVKIEDAVAVVPSLAIHLQRGVNEDGFVPAKNSATNALVSLLPADADFNQFIASHAGIVAEKILSYDLSFFDLCKAARGGMQNEFLFSARLDNLVSCFTALNAIQQPAAENTIQVAMLFDHEEIGSVSEGGAASVFAETFLENTAGALGLTQKQFQAAMQRSLFLSADMAHGLHPNFTDKHDDENRPKLGGGVTLKINQNRRYATSAATQAVFHDICRTQNIVSQVYTHRNDLPCGSTIGPTISAKLGMPTLDVGVAMLAMHSVRETCAWDDLAHYAKFMKAFFHSAE